jgi:hypothetical protein
MINLINLFDIAIIFPNQGMGDHIVCNGMYRALSEKHRLVFIVVVSKYVKEIKRMTGDRRNIIILCIPNKGSSFWAKYAKRMKFIPLKSYYLGDTGDNFRDKSITFDQNFYKQIGLNFSLSHDNFHVRRKLSKEEKLYDLLVNHQDYVLIHEDYLRDYKIKTEYLKNFKNIVAIKPIKGFTIFDYQLIIEQASEIHCIESSFSAFIDRISLREDKKLVAHRYARPEAKSNSWYEYKYSKNWIIVNE